MSELDSMIKIDIVEAAAGVSVGGFGVPLILANDLNLSDRVASYTPDDDYAADFCDGSPALAAIAAVFAQNPAPSIVKVGNVSSIRTLNQLVTLTVTAANATVGAVYTSGGLNFTVLATIAAKTSLLCRVNGIPAASGTLTLSTGTGDTTIAYSAVAGGTWTAGTAYVTVNGKTASHAWATDAETSLTALAAAILVAAADYLAASTGCVNTAGALIFTPKTGVVLEISWNLAGITGAMSFSQTGARTEDLDTALAAIRLVDDEWFYVSEVERTAAQVEKVAAAIAALPRVHLFAAADSNIINETVLADTTSLAAIFKGLAYANTAGIYKGDAATKFSDAALLGWLAANDKPGSYTACFKTLLGETPDSLTTQQVLNSIGSPIASLAGKNINTYQTIANKPMLRFGVCSDGGFLDEIIFKFWLAQDLQSRIATLFVQTPKVPGDINGATMIMNAMVPSFKTAFDNNAIAANGTDNDPTSATYKKQNSGWYITLPDMSLRSISDKSLRNLSGIKFGCWYTGAIHTVHISGMLI
jgi:hypothetical protein